VTGWTRLIEKNDVETLRAWKALRSDVIEPLTQEHGGRLLESRATRCWWSFQARSRR
jgi:hypothetical protein